MRTIDRRVAKIEGALWLSPERSTVIIQHFGSEITGARCETKFYPRNPGESLDEFAARLDADVPFPADGSLRCIQQVGEPNKIGAL